MYLRYGHRTFYFFIFFLWLFCSCASQRYQRSPVSGFSFGSVPKNIKADLNEEAFAMAVSFGTPDEIEVFLKAGHDPNRMTFPGAIPWHDTNPLWSLTHYPDKAALFIRYGADVTKRPYIAAIFTNKIVSERFPDESLFEYRPKHEKEVYNMVKVFLDAGADPNFKGDPGSRVLAIATDWNYKKYFEKYGQLPINAAIKQNAFTIVDMLLEYGSILDEESLECAKEATERSGHTDMEDYIKEVWEKQNLNQISTDK
jgi:hypothetical protein